MNNVFGTRLMELRRNRGITRENLADIFEMSANTLRNYENGSREPGHQFIIRVAKYFDVTTDYLLGVGNEQEKSPTSDNTEIGDEEEFNLFARSLVSLGYLREGEDFTEQQLAIVLAIIQLLDAAFPDRRTADDSSNKTRVTG